MPPTMLERLTGLGVVSTVLAFASFWYLMDLRFAVIVATVILLHQLGHAIAMRLVGLQVKGIIDFVLRRHRGPEDAVSHRLPEGLRVPDGTGI